MVTLHVHNYNENFPININVYIVQHITKYILCMYVVTLCNSSFTDFDELVKVRVHLVLKVDILGKAVGLSRPGPVLQHARLVPRDSHLTAPVVLQPPGDTHTHLSAVHFQRDCFGDLEILALYNNILALFLHFGLRKICALDVHYTY